MRIIVLVLLGMIILTDVFGQKYDFQNPTLSVEQRVEDLISRMTIEEKASQLHYDAPAIQRLGIPKYNWWNESLHGVARNGGATVFPQAIGLAATFDVDLMHRVAMAISDEGRAKYNAASKLNYRNRYQGLTFWTPNVNIFRDPRWGRGQETYGEDPYLTSRMGVAFVKGLQGDDPNYIKGAACAKHYAVHNGPEEDRHTFDAVVSMQDMWDTYLPAFEALVKEAKVEGVMGAYNRTNGDPCSAHPYLMQDVLRKQWGFKGYFTSDCWAIVDFYNGHNVVETEEEAIALALKTGCNLNCGSAYLNIKNALAKNLITETDLDNNLRELLPTRFRLGLMDPIGTSPFDAIGPEVIRQPKHIDLTLEAATKSMVLLKNQNKALPIPKSVGSIFITGPMATHMQALLANYYGLSENMVTFMEGIVSEAAPHTQIKYRQGALIDRDNINPMDWFSDLASEADVTIACVGISQIMEGEEGESIMSPHKGDRVDIGLPENQIEFLKKIRSKANKLIVVLTSGSALACPEVYEMADALIYAWYPGEQGGAALANLIFGNENPSGRLPITVPFSVDDLAPYEDYNMNERTYRYSSKKSLFPFGFGLSYTNFEYSNIELSKDKIKRGKTTEVKTTVTNTGSKPGSEVV
ncbi:MAG: glycoside hydrolase family 3 N-terminal domain-containing protein, partial [Bacteroidota bacterium]